MLDTYHPDNKTLLDSLLKSALNGDPQQVAEKLFKEHDTEPQELLIYCIEKNYLKELETLCQIPDFHFSNYYYWPLRMAIYDGFTEAVTALTPFCDIENLFDTLVEERLKRSELNDDESRTGYDVFGLLLPDELKERWVEVFKEDCPCLGAELLSKKLPKGKSKTTNPSRL